VSVHNLQKKQAGAPLYIQWYGFIQTILKSEVYLCGIAQCWNSR